MSPRKIFSSSASRWFILTRLSGVLLSTMEGQMCYLRLLLIFDLLVSTAAFADVAPCSKDRLKFCNDGKAAPENVRACLLQHKDELSDACRARLGDSATPG